MAYTILDLGKKNAALQPEAYATPWLVRGGERKRLHIAGLGSVGSTMLIGLRLMGAASLSEIGIYDLSEAQCARWEHEGNQILEPFAEAQPPVVKILKPEELFDCDVFVFCVAKAVPEVGSGVKDVRMAQYEANAGIVKYYAKQAADCGYQGLFIVVSDPVDLLCSAAFKGSQAGAHPLTPGQIQGCGLGVMNARATYYAGKEERFARFFTEGRVFGPHGKDLVVADSIVPEHYSEEASLALTKMTVEANLEIRELGFKPYVAPALSSAAYTILRILNGKWNYSANYLNGVWFGAKNRTTAEGIEWEVTELPDALFARLQTTYESLRKLAED